MRLIGVSLSGLTSAVQQSLFDEPTDLCRPCVEPASPYHRLDPRARGMQRRPGQRGGGGGRGCDTGRPAGMAGSMRRAWPRHRMRIWSGTVASADGGLGQAVLMRRRHSRLPAPRSSFAGFRFPPEVITVAVRWYLRYGLSYRDIEELLAERGIEVDSVKPRSYGMR